MLAGMRSQGARTGFRILKVRDERCAVVVVVVVVHAAVAAAAVSPGDDTRCLHLYTQLLVAHGAWRMTA